MYIYDDELCLNDREMRLLNRCVIYLNPAVNINSNEFNILVTVFKKDFANAIENKESRYQAFKTALLVATDGNEYKMLETLKYGGKGNLTDRFIMILNNSELLKRLHITPS